MASSSQTAQPTSKIITDDRLIHGLRANTSSQWETSGFFRTSTAGASTAGTSVLFLARSFNIAYAPCGRFLQKCLSRSPCLPAIAAIPAAIAWSGHVTTIPLALLVLPLMFHTRSRIHSYATLFFYYIGASWPLIPGASTFFGARGTIIKGILICFGACALLASPGALLFTRNTVLRPFATAGMFLLAAVPPLGIIGWASPILAAGPLFPGTGWLGLIGTVGLFPLLLRYPLRTAAIAAVVALVANTLYTPATLPTGWQAANTTFGGAGQGDPDFLAEFTAHEQMQETIRQSKARVLLFPEHVVTQWNEATEAFWHLALEDLVNRHATLLIGAGLPRSRATRFTLATPYYNVLIAKDPQTQSIYYQRIPVPVVMWKPLAYDGVPLNLFGPGTLQVDNQRAAVLICYEELLVWPFLSSAFEHPTVLITVANDYWARHTPIPEIQKASAVSWARLFRLPMLSAVNE